ncbi:MAG: 1,4-dihydroxy-2-naphthoate polyprenyltransferase [Gammaproteobacteria bacterium]|nr:MAG: 1,4-dihydroxy-2-naphthoate polyprenyltransferase [Gammaproteobacteria bacterium]
MNASPVVLWLLAARPKTLPAALAPVLVGTVMAASAGLAHWPAAVAALLGALLIQVGTNFANDYFDFLKGADTAARVGPRRMVQSGLISPAAMRRAAVIAFALAVLVGAYLVWRGGLPILAVGLVSIASGVLYTGGPWPLAYKGLGDLFVLVFFGPVAVGGTYYVQALTIDGWVLLAGLGPGLVSVAILTVNNLRDIDTDARADKRTLAVRLGPDFARWEYLLALLAAAALPLVFLAAGRAGPAIALTLLVPLAAIPAIRRVFAAHDALALNRTLATTGQLLLLHAVLFSIGWTL